MRLVGYRVNDRALQDKRSRVARLAEPKEKPLQAVSQEDKVEFLAALFGQVEEPLSYGRGHIARRLRLHETIASR
jgi:hypothetical protein